MMDHALTILERLIAFDTTSRRSNLELVDWIADRMGALGLPMLRVSSDDGSKANLLVRMGPDVPGGVILSGHTDVVPVDGQAWTSDPWTMTRRDDRLYGRGVADMKGFIALVLDLFESHMPRALIRPLYLALTYDEEVGCLGAPLLIERLPEMAREPSLAVIGEPTDMKVVSVHKGMRIYDVEVMGREAHSSQREHGVSAITAAVEMMSLIGELDAEGQAAATSDDPCSPPGTTLSVGIVEGGTASNILARRCSFRFDLRSPREADADRYEARVRERAEEIAARIRAVAPEGGVTVTRLAAAPPLEKNLASAAETFVRSLTGDNGVHGAAFVAEAGLYQRAGVPAVLCGPGSILQAHQPDEWIAVEQLRAGAAFLRGLTARLQA